MGWFDILAAKSGVDKDDSYTGGALGDSSAEPVDTDSLWKYISALDLAGINDYTDRNYNIKDMPILGAPIRRAIDGGLNTWGGILNYAGDPYGLGSMMIDKADQEESTMYHPDPSLSWGYITDPNGLAGTIADVLGSAVSLGGPGLAARGFGAGAGRLLAEKSALRGGLLGNLGGRAAEYVPGAIAFSATTPLEAMSEGGSAMRDVYERGASMADAQQAGRDVFDKNIGLLALTNAVEGGIAGKFMNRLKGARRGRSGFGRSVIPEIGVGTGINAFEEGEQQGIQDASVPGKEYSYNPADWNDEQKAAAIQGGIGAFGLSGLGALGSAGMNRLNRGRQDVNGIPSDDITSELDASLPDIDMATPALAQTAQPVANGSNGPDTDKGKNEWLGKKMDDGENGCVEAVTKIGSSSNSFLANELSNGVVGVPKLVEDAGDMVVPFDASNVAKGDVIVYGDNDHVVLADGNGGYIGNSSSKNKVIEGDNYNEMGGLKPTKIIKTGGVSESSSNDKGSSSLSQSSGNEQYDGWINQYANQYGVPANLLYSLIKTESSFDPNAKSGAGAIGLAQFMPETAKEVGIDPTDPQQSIEGAAIYLRQKYDKHGDWHTALEAYNGGDGNVGIEETKAYADKVLGGAGDISASAPQAGKDSAPEDYSKLFSDKVIDFAGGDNQTINDIYDDFANYVKDTSSDAHSINFISDMFSTDRRGRDRFDNTAENRQSIADNMTNAIRAYVIENLNAADSTAQSEKVESPAANKAGSVSTDKADVVPGTPALDSANKQEGDILQTTPASTPDERKLQGSQLTTLAHNSGVPIDTRLAAGLKRGYKKAIIEAQERISNAPGLERGNQNENNQSTTAPATQGINAENHNENTISKKGQTAAEEGKVDPLSYRGTYADKTPDHDARYRGGIKNGVIDVWQSNFSKADSPLMSMSLDEVRQSADRYANSMTGIRELVKEKRDAAVGKWIDSSPNERVKEARRNNWENNTLTGKLSAIENRGIDSAVRVASHLYEQATGEKPMSGWEKRQNGKTTTPNKGVSSNSVKNEENLKVSNNAWDKSAQNEDSSQWIANHRFSYDTSKSVDENIRIAEQMAQEYIDRFGTTNKINTPGRDALRQNIVDRLYGNGAKKKGNEVYLIIGLPASGKSAIADPLVKEQGAILIDSDEAKKLLPEFSNGLLATAVHEESSIITNQVINKAMDNGDNIVMPIVGKTYSSLKRKIDGFRLSGYKINLVYVELPVEKAIERVKNRFKEEGRLVSPKYLASIGLKPKENYDKLKSDKEVDSYEAWNNDVRRGQQPILLEQGPSESGMGRLRDKRYGLGESYGSHKGTPSTKGKNANSEQLNHSDNQGGFSVPGNRTTVISDNGNEIKVVYKIVPADSLITSNSAKRGLAINPDYPKELQPRDRQRKSMEHQITEMSYNLRPRSLGESENLNEGAPIIRDDRVVLNGNGRTISVIRALKAAKSSNMLAKSAKLYYKFLVQNAEKFGIEKKNVLSMITNHQNPVLVREVVGDISSDMMQDIIGSTAGGSRMGASEQAKADAKKITIEALERYAENDNGDITTAANRDFVAGILYNVASKNDINALLDKNGNVNADGIQRVKRALFSLAYGDDDLISKMAESTDDNTRNISNALMSAAPEMARLNIKIRDGIAYPIELAKTISEATKRLDYLRQQGQTVENYLSSQSMFDEYKDTKEMKEVLKYFDDNKRRSKKIGKFISRSAEIIDAMGGPNQETLIHTDEKTLNDIIQQAEGDVENGGQSSLFMDEGREAGSNEALQPGQRERKENVQPVVQERPAAADESVHVHGGQIETYRSRTDTILEQFNNKEINKSQASQSLKDIMGDANKDYFDRKISPAEKDEVQAYANDALGEINKQQVDKSRKRKEQKEVKKYSDNAGQVRTDSDREKKTSQDNDTSRFGDENDALNDMMEAVGKKKALNVIDDSDKALADAVKEFEHELNNISSMPMFNPKLMVAGFKVGMIYFQRGVNHFAAWSKAMLAASPRLKPFLPSIWEAVNKYPADVKFNEKVMSSVMRYVGTQYDKGVTDKEIIRSAVEKAIGKEYAGIVDSAYAGVEKFPSKEEYENGQSAKSEGLGSGHGGLQSTRIEADEEKGERPKADGRGTGSERPDEEKPGRNTNQSDSQRPAAGRVPGGSELAETAGDGAGTGRDISNVSELTPAQKKSAKDSEVPGHNFHIGTDTEIGSGGIKTKYKQNIEAIKLLKQLEDEGRRATPVEQEVLAKYNGWGGLASVFSDDAKWSKENKELHDILTKEEYDSAKATITSAYYTDPAVVRAIWSGLERMGFHGGRVLDPSMGVGHFFGCMPENIAKNSLLSGVELDGVSGRIAKQLYQNGDVRIGGFETMQLPDNYFDLAISNVPFGQVKLHDSRYDKFKYKIHNYFFAKAMDKVRPGGLVVFITGQGTMQSADDAETLRNMLGRQADFIGAFKLPNTAFKGNAGTEVTTDVVILQKRVEASHPAKYAEKMTVINNMTLHGDNGSIVYGKVNGYYNKFPKHVLGKFAAGQRAFGANEGIILDGSGVNAGTALKKAIQSLPEDIYQGSGKSGKQYDTVQSGKTLLADNGLRDMEYMVKNDRAYQNDGGTMKAVPEKQQKKIKAYVALRGKLRSILLAQIDPKATDGVLSVLRTELNTSYNSFIKSYGYLNEAKNTRDLRTDPDCGTVQALEKCEFKKERGKQPKLVSAKKTAIFTKRTVSAIKDMEKAESPADALTASLANRNAVDIDYIANLLGQSPAQVVASLKGSIYHNPYTQSYETADEYLSGNVREKLEFAKEAAKANPAYEENVKALEKIQPKELIPEEISVTLGTPWVPVSDVQTFVNSLSNGKIDVSFSKFGAHWSVNGWGSSAEFSTGYADFKKILESALNQKSITIYRNLSSDSKAVDGEATTAANQKVQELRSKFEEWIWSDNERADRLAAYYNRNFNNQRLREYDGECLNFPGMNAAINMKPHQKSAVWRIMQRMNTLLAHCVGAGKTFTMQAAGMEMRRLGICKKPMYCVPNNIVEQFGKEFYQLYPNAKILTLTSKDLPAVFKSFTVDKDGNIIDRKLSVEDKAKRNQAQTQRNRMLARIATEDWDGIIISHSLFERLAMGKDATEEFYRRQVDDLEQAITEARQSSGAKMDKRFMKGLETKKATMENRLKAAMHTEDKDIAIPFEQLGVDQLFVDEADMYKNLEFPTSMDRIAGISNTGSNRSMDMFAKTQYLTRLNNGRGVVFATGTPISNSMAEMFTMMRYLDMKGLEDSGLSYFDNWANQFARIGEKEERDPSGNGYRVIKKVTSFVNTPELIKMFRKFADVKQADEIVVERPKLKNGKRTVVEIEPSASLETYIKQEIRDRVQEIRRNHGKPAKGQDNMLSVTNDLRKASLDLRLVKPEISAKEANGKVEAVGKLAADKYRETSDVDGAQLIFCDLSTPKGSSENITESENLEAEDNENITVYDEIKKTLIKNGVPADQIAFVHDAKTKADLQDLFEQVNEGHKRILIGSTAKMGAGTNCQKHLVALHHLDAPWRPRDIEQREGRILRQGNDNKEVEIFTYVTKGSYDANMWEKLKNKAAIISQAMSGNLASRVIDDADEAALSYAEAEALATDNPLMAEKTTVDANVTKYGLLQNSYIREQREAQRKIETIPAKIEQAKGMASKAAADIKDRVSTKGDAFRAKIGNKIYTDRPAADKAIAAIIKTVLPGKGSIKIGEIGGFDMKAIYQKTFSIDGSANGDVSITLVNHSSYATGKSKIASIEHSLMNSPEKIKEGNEKLADTLARSLEEYREKVKAPFKYADKLQELKNRQAEINAELKQAAAGKDETPADTVTQQETTPAVVDTVPQQKEEHKEATAIHVENETAPVADSSSFTAGTFIHTKTGKEIPQAKPTLRLGDSYNSIASLAKKHGGYYSRYSKSFLFEDDFERDEFIDAADALIGNNTKYSVDNSKNKGDNEGKINRTFMDIPDKANGYFKNILLKAPDLFKGIRPSDDIDTVREKLLVPLKMAANQQLSLYNKADNKCQAQAHLNLAAYYIGLIDEGRRQFNAGHDVYGRIINNHFIKESAKEGSNLKESIRKRNREIAKGRIASKTPGAADGFIKGSSSIVEAIRSQDRGDGINFSASAKHSDNQGAFSVGDILSGPIAQMRAEITFPADSKLTKEQRGIVAFGKMIGCPVIFFDGDSRLNGFHSKGKTFLNRKAGMSLERTFWHETFHWLVNNNPTLSKEMASYVKGKEAFSAKDLDVYRQEVGQPRLSDDAVIEEMMSDAMVDVKRRVEFMRDLGREDMNLAQRFIAWIRDRMNDFSDLLHKPLYGLTTVQRNAMVQSFARMASSMVNADGQKIFRVSNRTNEVQLASGKPLTDVKYSVDRSTNEGDNGSKKDALTDEMKDRVFRDVVFRMNKRIGYMQKKGRSKQSIDTELAEESSRSREVALKNFQTYYNQFASPKVNKRNLVERIRRQKISNQDIVEKDFAELKSLVKEMLDYAGFIYSESSINARGSRKSAIGLHSWREAEQSNAEHGGSYGTEKTENGVSEKHSDNQGAFSVDETKNSVSDIKKQDDAIGTRALKKIASKIFKGRDDIKVAANDDTETHIGIVADTIVSPSRIAEKVPGFKQFYQWADNAMNRMTKLRSAYNRKLDAALKIVNKKERADLFQLLWDGDGEGKEYTHDEIIADGHSENVAESYKQIRRLVTKAYIMLNDARRQVKTKTERMSSKKLEELRKNKFAEVLKVEEDEDGSQVVTWRESGNWEKDYLVGASELALFEKDDAMQVLSKEASGQQDENGNVLYEVHVRETIPNLNKRKGYIPHFFHDYMIRLEGKDSDGNKIHRVIGSANNISEAYKKVDEWLESNASKVTADELKDIKSRIVISPKVFDFTKLGMDENKNAAVMGDRDFQKMLGRIAKKNDISFQEAKEMVKGSAKQKNKHRFYGNFMKRTGAKGYEEDMDWVLRHFFNSSSRYAAMESLFKPQAMALFERLYGRFDAEYRKLPKYVKDYINDINGVPSALEDTINDSLNNRFLWRHLAVSHYGDRAALQFSSSIANKITIAALGFFNVSSALINFTQLANAAAYIGDPKVLYKGLQRGAHKKYSLHDRRVLVETGVLNDIGLDSGSGYGQFSAGKWMNRSMFLFKTAEGVIRRGTVLAAYEAGIKRGMNHKQAIEFAKEVNRKSNFDYGVQDAPNVFRRGSIVSQLMLQFKKYSIKELEVMRDMLPLFSNKTSAKQKAIFWGSYFLLGGLFQIPFGDWIDDVLALLMGSSPKSKIKSSIMQWCGNDPMKKAIGKVAMYGISSMAGVDVSSRVGVADIMPQSAIDALGPAASKVTHIISNLRGGNYSAALRSYSPGLANIYMAASGKSIGSRGRTNATYDDNYSRLLRLAGFRSTEEAIDMDIQEALYNQRKETKDDKQKAIDDYLNDESSENLKRVKALGITPETVKKERERKKLDRLGRTKAGMSKEELKNNQFRFDFAK